MVCVDVSLLDFVSFLKHHNLHHDGKVCGENMEGKVIKRKLRYELMYVKGYCVTGIGGGEGSMSGQLRRRVEDDLNIT